MVGWQPALAGAWKTTLPGSAHGRSLRGRFEESDQKVSPKQEGKRRGTVANDFAGRPGKHEADLLELFPQGRC